MILSKILFDGHNAKLIGIDGEEILINNCEHGYGPVTNFDEGDMYEKGSLNGYMLEVRWVPQFGGQQTEPNEFDISSSQQRVPKGFWHYC